MTSVDSGLKGIGSAAGRPLERRMTDDIGHVAVVSQIAATRRGSVLFFREDDLPLAPDRGQDGDNQRGDGKREKHARDWPGQED